MTRRLSRQTQTKDLGLQMGLKALEAKRKLALANIDMPERPEYAVPDLPEDLTEQSDRDLIELFRQLTEWLNYMGTQVAAAEVDEHYAEGVVDKYKALVTLGNKSEKTVSVMKAAQYEDVDFLEATEEFTRAYSFRKLAQAAYQNADRKSFLVSRELTRRVGRNDRDNRSAKWST